MLTVRIGNEDCLRGEDLGNDLETGSLHNVNGRDEVK
jgi:hypothetical protein